ncbi:MAG: MgtC/SapB family protein [Candidatus Terrybacteria bacterium]|nr:MgtC/SapB family protein [Candidatus Terrybacteria bacterium]
MELFSNIDWNIFLRLFVAMILGVAIGIERTVAHKTAGMRTYGLVSMGAALFVIISSVMTQQYSDTASLDPLRMASQIIVGIGFLGAGLIIFRESTLSGLTTAAGLWVAGGIGTACGFGLYTIAIFATILTLFIFSILWIIENKIKKITDANE